MNFIPGSVFTFYFEAGSHHVAQAGLEQLTHCIAEAPISVCLIDGVRGAQQNVLPVIIHSLVRLVT